MPESWFDTPWQELLTVVLSSIIVLAAAIGIIRIIGLRSLSKMSSFDFVVTIALGSIVAAVAATSTPIEQGGLAFATLLAAQWVISTLRLHAPFQSVVDNAPILLMHDGQFIPANLRSSRVTEGDIIAKLREANVTNFEQVLAVVLEATGDISVLHGDGPLEPALLTGVRQPTHSVRGQDTEAIEKDHQ